MGDGEIMGGERWKCCVYNLKVQALKKGPEPLNPIGPR